MKWPWRVRLRVKPPSDAKLMYDAVQSELELLRRETRGKYDVLQGALGDISVSLQKIQDGSQRTSSFYTDDSLWWRLDKIDSAIASLSGILDEPTQGGLARLHRIMTSQEAETARRRATTLTGNVPNRTVVHGVKPKPKKHRQRGRKGAKK